MKKTLALVLALLLASAAALAASAVYAGAESESVEYTPTVLAGSEDAAAGLELTLERAWLNWSGGRGYPRPYWRTVWTKDGSETEFELLTELNYYPEYDGYTGVNMYIDYSSSHDDEGYWLNRAFDDLAAEVEPGSSGDKYIRVADYTDYYPLAFDIDMPGYTEMLMPTDVPHLEPQQAADYEALSEFFRIPVLDTETISISLEKDNEGRVFSRGSASGGEDAIQVYVESAVIGNCAYIVLPYEGEAPDFSLIPGGYGIYRLPFSDGKMLTDELENVYPTDDGTQVLGITAMDCGRLALHTYENGAYVLTVIDTESFAAVQRLELLSFDYENMWYTITECDGFMVLVVDDGTFSVAAEENGLYDLRMSGDGMAWAGNADAVDYEYALSGGRLAVAGNVRGDDGWVYDRAACGFYLAVYEGADARLAYHGVYSSTLDEVSVNEAYGPVIADMYDVGIRFTD